MTAANDRPVDQPKGGGKHYAAPVLTEYGSVSKLTMAKGGSFLETPTQKKTTSCL
jgi:hypothetical protein